MSNNAGIDIEALYRVVSLLEGPRNVHSSPGALDRAADRIGAEMGERGIATRELPFQLEGSDHVFRIVEGTVGEPSSGPARVLVAHYDTVERSPGANDNAAGIALILEVGACLARMPGPPHVRIVAVPQEESSQPAFKGREIESALRHSIVDQTLVCTSWAYHKARRFLQKRSVELMDRGMGQGEAYVQALDEYESREGPVGADFRTHVGDLGRIYAGLTTISSIGFRSRVGSARWLEAFLAEGGKVDFAVAVDEPGIYSEEPGSQGPVPSGDFKDMTRSHLLKPDIRAGNFATIVAISGSSGMGLRLADHLESQDVAMPYGLFDIPLDFRGVAGHLPKILGSDHAPFWLRGIPAIFVFDMSIGRDPWNHTAADTIDRIDFESLRRLAEGVFRLVAGS
ncbi:MAG: M28 family peptidase [Rectinemataceae bacterium]